MNYDASSGARCKDQPPETGMFAMSPIRKQQICDYKYPLAGGGIYQQRRSTDSGEGNADCRTQTIGSLSGLSCKWSTTPCKQTDSATSQSIYSRDRQLIISLGRRGVRYAVQSNGSSWRPVSNTAYYYTFNEIRAQTRSMFSSRATSLSRW